MYLRKALYAQYRAAGLLVLDDIPILIESVSEEQRDEHADGLPVVPGLPSRIPQKFQKFRNQDDVVHQGKLAFFSGRRNAVIRRLDAVEKNSAELPGH